MTIASGGALRSIAMAATAIAVAVTQIVIVGQWLRMTSLAAIAVPTSASAYGLFQSLAPVDLKIEHRDCRRDPGGRPVGRLGAKPGDHKGRPYILRSLF